MVSNIFFLLDSTYFNNKEYFLHCISLDLVSLKRLKHTHPIHHTHSLTSANLVWYVYLFNYFRHIHTHQKYQLLPLLYLDSCKVYVISYVSNVVLCQKNSNASLFTLTLRVSKSQPWNVYTEENEHSTYTNHQSVEVQSFIQSILISILLKQNTSFPNF